MVTLRRKGICVYFVFVYTCGGRDALKSYFSNFTFPDTQIDKLSPAQPSLVSSRNAPPHKRLLNFEPHSFHFVMGAWCLHVILSYSTHQAFVWHQTNHGSISHRGFPRVSRKAPVILVLSYGCDSKKTG